jgi:hypothetical protein
MGASYHARVRERSLGDARGSDHNSDMAIDHYPNDERQASLTVILLAIMSVIIAGLITAAVLSTKACSV